MNRGRRLKQTSEVLQTGEQGKGKEKGGIGVRS